MAEKSLIEWTESSWNPITGCSKVSDGCKNCYAERLALRLKKMGVKKYRNGFKLTLHPESLDEPLRWKTPRMIFVCSMSDLFHKDVPEEFIKEIFRVMNDARMHTFQVLTKRAERLAEFADKVNWTSNIWAGVTVESEKYLYRVEYLRKVPAVVKFISMEPLLSPVSGLRKVIQGIDWVIVGGESGFNARPMKAEWVREIRDICEEFNVPFFFKQWGGVNKKKTGRELDGKIYDGMPSIIENSKLL
ncbi:MAG: phage Gp37/Gp68 family protein [Desulfurobacteriaceae bacterium]